MKKFIFLFCIYGILCADVILQFADVDKELKNAQTRVYKKIAPIMAHSEVLEEGFIQNQSIFKKRSQMLFVKKQQKWVRYSYGIRKNFCRF
ncbi:hypothetical protein [Candidatus Uabimicrobium sp. HlEnr_7]|uniref:hypothetical protein n=1 Tax=Candidatus Uabimicrobium helgolandensis TaxID=3095367 RepID=UPI0035582E36